MTLGDQKPANLNGDHHNLRADHNADLAEHIAWLRRSGSAVLIREDERPKTEAEGYILQGRVNSILAETLGKPCGFKIGCTTEVMQDFLGIHSPCSGEVFESTVHHRSATVERSAFRRIGVECEIVAILRGDIQPSGAPFTAHSLADHIFAWAAGIEIVDDRYADFRTLGAPSLIADNFFNAGAVIGKPETSLASTDIKTISARMIINGEQVGMGHGAMVMGDPLNSLAWLLNSRASQGLGLKDGDFVYLGSVVETQWVAAGDDIKVEIDGFDDVELRIR